MLHSFYIPYHNNLTVSIIVFSLQINSLRLNEINSLKFIELINGTARFKYKSDSRTHYFITRSHCLINEISVQQFSFPIVL